MYGFRKAAEIIAAAALALLDGDESAAKAWKETPFVLGSSAGEPEAIHEIPALIHEVCHSYSSYRVPFLRVSYQACSTVSPMLLWEIMV